MDQDNSKVSDYITGNNSDSGPKKKKKRQQNSPLNQPKPTKQQNKNVSNPCSSHLINIG